MKLNNRLKKLEDRLKNIPPKSVYSDLSDEELIRKAIALKLKLPPDIARYVKYSDKFSEEEKAYAPIQ